MLPSVWGKLESSMGLLGEDSHMVYTLTLEFGQMEVAKLAVDECSNDNLSANNVHVLSASKPLRWNCPIKKY